MAQQRFVPEPVLDQQNMNIGVDETQPEDTSVEIPVIENISDPNDLGTNNDFSAFTYSHIMVNYLLLFQF